PGDRPALLVRKGYARGLGAAHGAPVKLPPIPGARERSAATAAEGVVPAGRSRGSRPSGRVVAGKVDGVEVRLEDPEGAPRYMITVIRGVNVAPSPAWLVERLAAVGQRPSNNVVDA